MLGCMRRAGLAACMLTEADIPNSSLNLSCIRHCETLLETYPLQSRVDLGAIAI